MIVRRPLIVLLLLAVFTSILYLARYSNSDRVRQVADKGWDKVQDGLDKINDKVEEIITNSPRLGNNGTLRGKPCEEDLAWLEQYQFSSTINYVSRDIITKPGAKSRPLVTKVDELLFEDFQSVNLKDPGNAQINSCLSPITLEVPHGVLKTADASNMIFGLQTTIGRLRETVKFLERWLPRTGARLFCIVKDKGDVLAKQEDMDALQKEFRDKGMDVSIIHPVNVTHTFEQRYFSLFSVMYQARNDKTEWIATIDDDTFFPSIHRLQEELKNHPSTKEQYISAMSENWWAVDHYGFMGFGGASIILSVPLAKIMDERKHECADTPPSTSGDVTVMECIYRFSTAKLTNLPELYQLDIKNDLSGFFESGRPILSFHHWKAGPEKQELDKTHRIADVCDDCFFQRWQFGDFLILSNGYSIQTYPHGDLVGEDGGATTKSPAKLDLLQMEETWDEKFNVKHSLSPLRPKLSKIAKVQYKILDSFFVVKDGKKCVRQVYARKGTPLVRIDDVMVLTWIPGDGKNVREGDDAGGV